MVELMGGKLTASSKIGEGSTFTVMLPHSYFEQPLIPNNKLSKRSISLVNFNEFSERVLTKQLNLWQADVNLVKDKRLKQQLYINQDNTRLVNNNDMEKLDLGVEKTFVDNYQYLFESVFEVDDHVLKEVPKLNKPILDKGHGEKLLLVEDSLPNQLVAKTLLENANYNIDIASNGIEAIELVEKNNYALVLMDLSMPKMDGAQACKVIRAKGEKYTSLPIWAMTANVGKGDIQHCLDAGMNDFIEKPINRKLRASNK